MQNTTMKHANAATFWGLYFHCVFNHVYCLQIFGLRSVIHSSTDSIGDNLSSYELLMMTGVRLATWNQILDPWVYILLRRTVLRKIYLIVKCQAQLNSRKLGRWEPTSFANSLNKVVHQVWADTWCLSFNNSASKQNWDSRRCGMTFIACEDWILLQWVCVYALAGPFYKYVNDWTNIEDFYIFFIFLPLHDQVKLAKAIYLHLNLWFLLFDYNKHF